MSVFETIGMLFVIFTSCLSTFAIGYLTMIGLKTVANVSLPKRLDRFLEDTRAVQHVEQTSLQSREVNGAMREGLEG